MDAKSVRNMKSITAVTKKHTAKLHHGGSLYILTYDARKLKHKIIHFWSLSRSFLLRMRNVSGKLKNTNFIFDNFFILKIPAFNL